MADSLFKAPTRTLGERTSRRAVIRGSVASAGAGVLGAVGYRASAREVPSVATPSGATSTGDRLPSWTDGAARQRILAFLDDVIDPASDAFVAPADRVATFDNDGTLWCEAPTIPQISFVVAYIRQQVEAHPELRTVQPYKSVWEGETGHMETVLADLAAGDMEAVTTFLETVMVPFAGMTPSEYEAIVQAFFDVAQHPELQVPYRHVIYQPMVELVTLLQANEFDVFIVTGGGRDFVRVISEDYYGIPRANVIGSSVELAYRADEAGGVLVRSATMDQPFDDGPGKPVRIEMHIGRQPILVGGNSDGDVAMLAYAQEQQSRFLGLLAHHDDAEREYAYDTGAETALELSGVHGWVVASMKDDFVVVFPSAT
jgi:phosphoglycolate phosphatase-like HAD superfamily hydrolase